MIMNKNYTKCEFKFNLLALFVFIAINIVAITNAYASSIVVDPSEGIDVVLVIDTSGSMRYADPERIALEAASLFMDMMETRNSRIGIVGFSGDTHSIMDLTPIHDAGVRDEIRHTVANFVYHGWTDIGLALRTAAEMLIENPMQENSPMILLFTDGRIDLPEWFGRSVETSYNDAWWAVENVGDAVPIYTIGLNYDGTVNVGFLEEIADRTHAESFMIEDAALLPELFHQIFANHIRSSINHIATIFPTEETYTDIIIPIQSHFVAEANIIMLSTRPITSVRLFDSLGREVAFDSDRYTISSANRYSMIKILEPEMGDWLLRIRGLPEDRITINLIYNYSIDIGFFINQPEVNGAYFNPTAPVIVQAGFITNLSFTQVQHLFLESEAEVHVSDLAMNLLEILPMEFNGTAFVTELMPYPPQDVRVNVNVRHPSFSQTTATITIAYDPAILLELNTQPEISETPEPNYIPEPLPEIIPEQSAPAEEPSSAPVQQEQEGEDTTNLLPFILIGTALFLILFAIIFMIFTKQVKRRVFSGYLEVRSLLKTGKYTALEAPDLSTFAGCISLIEFLQISLGSKAKSILNVNVPINGIHIEPAEVNGRVAIKLTTDGACQITDSVQNPITGRKLIWEKDSKLEFSLANASTSEKIEITYRINID